MIMAALRRRRDVAAPSKEIATPALLLQGDAPPHSRSRFILSGYRRPEPRFSFGLVMAGLFSIHNESLNVWSHVFAALWALLRLAQVVASQHHLDSTTVVIFLASAAACFSFSATFHLLGPVLPAPTAAQLYTLDMNGIVLAIGGSYFPGLYFGFRCHPPLQRAYVAITAALVAASFVVTLAPIIRDAPQWSWLRVGTLSSTVAFGLLPLAQWVAIAPLSDRELLLGPLLQMFGLYGLGFVFWHYKVPERWSPGSFDTWLASHFWWHVLVFAAVATWDEDCHRMLENGLAPC